MECVWQARTRSTSVQANCAPRPDPRFRSLLIRSPAACFRLIPAMLSVCTRFSFLHQTLAMAQAPPAAAAAAPPVPPGAPAPLTWDQVQAAIPTLQAQVAALQAENTHLRAILAHVLDGPGLGAPGVGMAVALKADSVGTPQIQADAVTTTKLDKEVSPLALPAPRRGLESFRLLPPGTPPPGRLRGAPRPGLCWRRAARS